MTIDDLDLSVRAYNTLKRAGIETIESLDLMKDADLLEIERFNEICLKDVKERLRLFKSGKHWECRYCDYHRGIPYPDEPETPMPRRYKWELLCREPERMYWR